MPPLSCVICLQVVPTNAPAYECRPGSIQHGSITAHFQPSASIRPMEIMHEECMDRAVAAFAVINMKGAA